MVYGYTIPVQGKGKGKGKGSGKEDLPEVRLSSLVGEQFLQLMEGPTEPPPSSEGGRSRSGVLFFSEGLGKKMPLVFVFQKPRGI